jgi:gliding motility-associated-like protein
MNRKYLNIIFSLFFINFICNVNATPYFVNDNSTAGDKFCSAIGSSSNNGISKSTPAATIQQIITNYPSIGSGDTIYVDVGYYNIQTLLGSSKSKIKLTNINGLVIKGYSPQSTIIDYPCNFGCNGINLFQLLNCKDITISNLTLKGFHGNSAIGDLIDISSSTNITIKNVAFGHTYQSADGHSIQVHDNSSVVFDGATFSCSGFGNASDDVPGLYTHSRNGAMYIGTTNVNVLIKNSVFSSNSSTFVATGAGIVVDGDVSVVVNIKDSQFSDNEGQDGAALIVKSSKASAPLVDVENSCFSNNVVLGDQDPMFPAGGYGGAVYVTAGTVNITNCDFANNKGILGGAIGVNGTSANVTISSCNFSGNTGSSGLDLAARRGVLKATNCTFGIGAASGSVLIFNNATSPGTITISKSGSPKKLGTVNIDNIARDAGNVTSANCPTISGACPVVYIVGCSTTISYPSASVCSSNTILNVSKSNSKNALATFSVSPINAGSTAALNTTNGDFDISKITVAGMYTITMAEGASCNPTFDLTVNTIPLTPTVGVVTQPTCTTNGTVQVTNYDNSQIYRFSPSSGISISGTGLISAPTGTYKFATSKGGCISDSISITFNAVPGKPTISGDQAICVGQSITLTGSGTPLSWVSSSNVIASVVNTASNTTNVTGISEGTVTITYTNASNCSQTVSIKVTPPPVDLTVSNVSPKYCKSDGKLVSDLAQITTNLTQTIIWYDAPVNGTAFKNGDLLITGTYYAEQSEGTCKSTNRTKVDVTIIDIAAPSLPGNNTQPTCLVATGSVEINMPSAGVWEITAKPVVGNPVKVNTNNLTTNPFTYSFAGLAPGSYTFQIKDENGCVSSTSTTVIIDQQPVSPATPILDATEIYCASKSYTVDQIKFSPAPTDTVKYYDANDIAISGKTVVVANTVYKFSFDNGKCESKVKLATTIPFDKGPTLLPLVDLTTALICAIDKPTFNTIIANSLLTIPSGYTLLISSDATGNPIVPNTTQIGSLGGVTQTVYYNIVNDKGCQSTSFAKLQFKINEGPTDLVLKNTKTYCATDNPTIASLNDTKISGSGTLKWYSSETSTNVLPIGTNLTSGTYFASATLIPGCESVARQSVVVTVQTFGSTTLDPTNTYTFCKGSNKTIADLSTKPYFSNELVWLNGNKVVQTPGTGLLPGTYFATETKNGCVSPNLQEIEVKFTSPIISITPSKLPTCGAGNGVLVITGADASFTYQWFKNGQEMTEKGSQISKLSDDNSIKYSVVVTDNKGCIALDTAMFTDCDPAEIPHIITPNGDGKNDKFVLNYESKYPKCSLTIFNRWGAMVYETKEVPYKDDWDGKPNVGATLGTNVLPAGTYFYMIEKGDGTTLESGYVELVK